MKAKNIVPIILLFFYSQQSFTQNKKEMEEFKNPLLCDPAVGFCEVPGQAGDTNAFVSLNKIEKPVKLIYYTDPICSSCWGIEPALRKFKLEYGDAVEIEYRMGGLLPDWSYNSGGISKPSDVAHHWDEVSVYYDMPIDGDVWLEDPLNSSYPASIAFKAAQIQSNDKAILFLRAMREMVFLEKKNIAKWEVIEEAAKKVALDVQQLKSDYDSKAKEMFAEDLKLAKEMGVRGFPTMFFTDKQGNREIVYGTKPYANYESALLKIHSKAEKKSYDKSNDALFKKYNSLTAKEYAELTGVPRAQSEQALDELVAIGKLEKLKTKNGAIWRVKSHL